jgi:tetratricopeptide (TPR) repeat protein
MWQRLLLQSPKDRIVLTRAGDACRTLGRLDQARSYYTEALAVGYDLFAELGMAKIEATEGNWPEAIRRLRALHGREPANLRVATDLADCHQLSGDPAEAARVLEGFAGRLDPDAEPPRAVEERLAELRRVLRGATKSTPPPPPAAGPGSPRDEAGSAGPHTTKPRS